MDFANVRSGNIGGSSNNIKLQNWNFEHLRDLLLHKCNSKMGLCVTFSGIKENFFDSPKLV